MLKKTVISIVVSTILAISLFSQNTQSILIKAEPGLCNVKIYRWVPFEDPRGQLLYEGLTPVSISISAIKDTSAIVIEITKDSYEPIIKPCYKPYQGTYSFILEKSKVIHPKAQSPPQKQEKPFSQYLEELINSVPLPEIKEVPETQEPLISQQKQNSWIPEIPEITVKPAQLNLPQITSTNTPDIPQPVQITVKPVDLSNLNLPTAALSQAKIENFPITVVSPDISQPAINLEPVDLLQPSHVKPPDTPQITIKPAEIEIKTINIDSSTTIQREPECLSYGKLYHKLGDYDKAERYLKEAITKYPVVEVQYQAYKELIILYGETKHTEKIKRILKELRMNFSGREQELSMICFRLAENHYEKSNYHEAEEILKTIIEIFPESVFAKYSYYLMGICLFSMKRYQESINWFREALAKFPETSFAPYALSYIFDCYDRMKKIPQMIEDHKQFIIQYPDSKHVACFLFQIGIAYQWQNEPVTARGYYQQLIENYPPDNVFVIRAKQEIEKLDKGKHNITMEEK